MSAELYTLLVAEIRARMTKAMETQGESDHAQGYYDALGELMEWVIDGEIAEALGPDNTEAAA